MELIKKGIYKESCLVHSVKKLQLSEFEKNNLKAVLSFYINGRKYIIKRINNYCFEYAAVLMDAVGRGYEVLYNSNRVDFLKTCLITKHAIDLPYKNKKE